MNPIDLAVILVYLALVFTLAFFASRYKGGTKGRTAEQQYLADKSLTFKESLLSIVATEVSALTFIAVPAYAFMGDFSFVQIYFGATFGRIIIALYFIPKFYDSGQTLYSLMGKLGMTVGGQRLTSVFFILTKILAVGVRLFSGSILVAEFFGLSISSALLIICFLTYLYTLIGGLKAVVRTDMLQMGLFILGGILAHYLIPSLNPEVSWGEMLSMASEAGKTSFFDWSNPWPFLVGVLGGFLFDIGTHGVDQDYVQRMTGNKSLKGAQMAIFCSSFFSIGIGFLFLSVGALLWSHYQFHYMPILSTSDYIFAHFITEHFPVGLRGLMVAGVLAATMSTLDSTINALSSCLYHDVFSMRRSDRLARYALVDTSIIAILLYGVAIWASGNEGLLILGLTVASWMQGPLLVLFLVTVMGIMKAPRLSYKAILGTYLAGLLGVYVNTAFFDLSWHWNMYWGSALSVIFLYLFSKYKLKKVL